MSDDPEDYIIEKVERNTSDASSEQYYYKEVRGGQGKLPIGLRIKIWALILGGIVIGTLLFLFFITAFIYFFIPALVLFAIWNLLFRKR